MLRVLVVLLLLANGVFFAWSRGWFAPVMAPPRGAEREPERVAAQVHPETVVVLPLAAASAAVSAARAAAGRCLEAGPLAEAEAGAAEGLLAQAHLPEGSWLREAAATPPLWLVYAGRVADKAALRVRAEELRRLKLSFEVIDESAELATGLVLSRHASRAEAETALAAATKVGPKGLRVVALPTPPAKVWLRVPKADSEQQAQLRALPAEALAGVFKDCAVRR